MRAFARARNYINCVSVSLVCRCGAYVYTFNVIICDQDLINKNVELSMMLIPAKHL